MKRDIFFPVGSGSVVRLPTPLTMPRSHSGISGQMISTLIGIFQRRLHLSPVLVEQHRAHDPQAYAGEPHESHKSKDVREIDADPGG